MTLMRQSGKSNWRTHGIYFVFIFMQTTIHVSALLPHRSRHLIPVKPNMRYLLAIQSKNENSNPTENDDGGSGDDDDDDDTTVKPYRNRSLAWTLRYRKLNPYEMARARVISFGHRSKDDWDEAASSGQLGQYVPTYPEEMYAPEWAGWDEWLGLMRSYNDTQQLAANILGLKNLDEYYIFVKSDSKRAEGLRIPLRPDLYYEDDWIDETHFFGKT